MEKESGCIFCKIIAGENPAKILFEDEQILVFQDARPIAPVHILLVPKKHIDSVNTIVPEDEPVLGYLMVVAGQIARQFGIEQTGYRLVFNTGPHAGQSVFHLHMHLIGGKHLPFRFE